MLGVLTKNIVGFVSCPCSLYILIHTGLKGSVWQSPVGPFLLSLYERMLQYTLSLHVTPLTLPIHFNETFMLNNQNNLSCENGHIFESRSQHVQVCCSCCIAGTGMSSFISILD